MMRKEREGKRKKTHGKVPKIIEREKEQETDSGRWVEGVRIEGIAIWNRGKEESEREQTHDFM